MKLTAQILKQNKHTNENSIFKRRESVIKNVWITLTTYFFLARIIRCIVVGGCCCCQETHLVAKGERSVPPALLGGRDEVKTEDVFRIGGLDVWHEGRHR